MNLRSYGKGDEKGIFDLWKRTFGNLTKESDIFEIGERWWSWRVLKNPGGFPPIYVGVKESGEIVAHQMIEKVNVLTRSEKKPFYLSTLTMCDKKYSGLHLLRLLNESMKKIKSEKAGGYGFPNSNSLEIFEKFKWKNIGEIPILVRPLNIFFRAFDLKPNPKGYKIKKIDKFDKNINNFIDFLTSKFDFLVERNADILNWRYFENPLKDYEKRLVLKGGEIEGYSVFRYSKINNTPVGIILDIFSKNEKGFDVLLNEIINYFSKKKISFITCFMINNSFFYKSLIKRGFIPVPKFLLPKRNVLIIFNSNLLDIKKWYISYGDWDCF